MSEFTHRLENGELVELTPEEVLQCEKEAELYRREQAAAEAKAKEIDQYVSETDVKTLIADMMKRQAGIV